MRILIAYSSSHGCTETCASELANALQHEVSMFNLKEHPHVSPDSYDAVIVAGSIHAGMIQTRIKKFCDKHTATLLSKPLALFVCCMEDGEKVQEQLEANFDEQLRKHALLCERLGGAFNFERMNFFQKMVVKKVSGVSESVEKIDREKIRSYAEVLNQL